MIFNSILSMTVTIARGMAGPLLIAIIALVGCGVAIDTLATDNEAIRVSTLGVSIVQLVLQLIVVRIALTQAGIDRDSKAGIGGLLLINIPLNLGVGVGLVLLILPGLYLSARWRLAVPHLLASKSSIGEAMGYSWDKTKPHWGPLMGLCALIGLGYVIGGGIVIAFGDEYGVLPLWAAIVSNLFLYGVVIWGWLIDVAAYRVIAPNHEGLAETFA